MKQVKVSNRKLARKPWITVGLLNSIATKGKVYKQVITKPTEEKKLIY